MSKKKPVVLKPFHEVAFETLEGGEESEVYKKLVEWISEYGQDGVLVISILLTRCVVPEAAQSRIVPALIVASKKLGGGEAGEVSKAVAFALTHFNPGKKGLKQLGKLLSADYLATEEYSDEAENLAGLLKELDLPVPDRPKKEETKAP